MRNGEIIHVKICLKNNCRRFIHLSDMVNYSEQYLEELDKFMSHIEVMICNHCKCQISTLFSSGCGEDSFIIKPLNLNTDILHVKISITNLSRSKYEVDSETSNTMDEALKSFQNKLYNMKEER